MREIKFKALYQKIDIPEDKRWAYYDIGGKPTLLGARWLTDDLQFTGLFDKQGKEIYEGDILRSQNEKIWVVKFGSCLKSDVAIEAAFYCESLDGEEDVVMEWPQDEIIGNIYESKHLIDNTETKA